ncbi:MAG: DNA recombination protein RmuC [Gemmatimonadetes bacterium]|nr:DNA recombination protein RmuC [Gemmatimonadota bacterium]
METTIPFITALCIGFVFGGLIIGLVMKLRTRSSDALRTEIDTAQSRIQDVLRTAEQYKKEAEQYRIQAAESGEERARLQTRFELTQTNLKGLQDENSDLKKRIEDWQKEATTIATANADLNAKLDAANKQLAERTDIENTLLAQFKNIATDAITNNNEQFLKNADDKIGALVKQAKSDFSLSKDAVQELIKPLSDELKRIEEARNQAQGSLKEQISTLVENNSALTRETRNLTNALKRPEVRGAWGEIQLRRVVELAGMVKYCDYDEQVNIELDDGNRERPDMVVRMPNQRTIVVDAKAPMNAYLEAIESDNDTDRAEAMKEHARQVQDRARALGQKSYQEKFNSPDFVVMFIPGEAFLQPALEIDRGLIDKAMQRKVVIATPSTLMALLKAVAMGWREAQIAEEAARIAGLGQELHDRINTFANHINDMRTSLTRTVESFNKSIGSLESRVLISTRRFKELGITSSQDIPELQEVEVQIREPRSLPTGEEIEEQK